MADTLHQRGKIPKKVEGSMGQPAVQSCECFRTHY